MGSRNNKPGRIVKGTAKQPTLKDASGVWTLDEAMQAHRANAWPQPNLFQPVANSLRLKNASSTSLARQASRPGNQRTWTWSGWVKRGLVDLNYRSLFATGSASDYILFWNDNSIAVSNFNATDYIVRTTQLFRDPSAWYHLVIAMDTTQATSSNRIKIYVNGAQVTSFAVSTYPSQNYTTKFNATTAQYLGYNEYNYFDGQMAEINFIDGYALDPSLLGKFDTNNTWVPVPYTGSYGTNGFYLPFNNATTSQTLGYDASLNGTTTYDVDQDPYRGSVALHLTGNGPAGGNNNVFADSSTNNLAITRGGTATQGSFSPFPLNTNAPYNPATHGASAYFNGSSDYLSIASFPAIGTQDFTVECWVYANSTATTGGYNPRMFDLVGIQLVIEDSGGRICRLDWNDANSLYTTGSGVFQINQWNHIAVVRISNVVSFYLNGVAQTGGTRSDNLLGGTGYIGSYRGATLGFWNGYISGFRATIGKGIYTAAFTPANRPFDTLTTNLITFSENFTSAWWASNTSNIEGTAVAPDGTPSATTLVAGAYPAAAGVGSSTVAVTGSIYAKANVGNQLTFRLNRWGSGADYVEAIFNLTTGVITSPTTAGTASGLATSIVNVGNGWWRCVISGTTSTTGGTISFNPNPTSGSIFIWGAQLETGGTATNYTPTPANFSTAPSLLLNFANAAVVDSAGTRNFVTTTNASITASSKYGQGALYFDGSASTFLSTPYSDGFSIGASDYTVEFWCNLSAYGEIVGAFNLTSPYPGWLVNVGNFGTAGKIGFFHANATVSQTVNSTNTVPLNTWTHIAVVKQNNFLKMFINGQLDSSHSLTLTSTGSGQQINIGSDANSLTAPGRRITGSLDDLRITKGVARYTTDFAPPARALPETGGKSFVTTNVNAGVVQRFTTTGTTSWTAPTDVTQVEVLVVGGGGSGGSNNAGGGGGGGLIYNNQYPVTPGQTYTVTVGAGGISQAGSGGTNSGYQGTLSQFGNLVATPGCGGYGGNGQRGQESGSGSGGGGCRGVGPGAGFPGQGFSGGANRVSPEGGGGGGAGGAGGTGPGNGGPGLQFGISGTPTYYAGGGGGGAEATPNSPVAGAGGLGGGGAGGAVSGATYAAGWSSGSGQAGTANTGGGGGGESAGNGGFVTGAGGSGVVIVRYTTTAVGNSSDATTDNLVDSPTQYGHDMSLGGEVVGNYATLNPLALPSGATLSNGNLTITGVTAYRTTPATIAMTSGKWYWENKLLTYTGSDIHIGVCLGNFTSFQGTWVLSTAFGWGYTCQGGYGYHNNTLKNISSSARSTGDTIGLAFDADGGNLYAYVNGVVVNGGSPIYTGLTSGPYFPFVTTGDSNTNVAVNFGQRAWAYTPPAGYNALTTKNLPRLAIGSAAATPNQYFGVSTWTQGATDVTLINDGGFRPDFVWIKSRANSQNHYLMDSVRGTTGLLRSNGTGAESTGSTWITFNSNGFTPSSANTVTNTYTYVAWQWKAGGAAVANTAGTISSQVSANTTSGFSIVTFTGTGSAATVGHGLGVAPKMVVIKQRNGVNNWPTWHAGIPGGTGYYIYWDSTNGLGTSTTVFNGTNPTSSVFSVGTNSLTNGSTNTYVAYCWAEVDGFSKIGSYIGNGSTDGPFVYCGFKPAYIMIKNTTTSATVWFVFDSKRSTYNPVGNEIYANDLDIEYSGTNRLDFVSNGFKVRNTSSSINTASDNYVFMAFAEAPFGNVNGVAR